MKMRLLAAMLLFLSATPALAGKGEARHGGKVVDAGDYHVELVARADTIEVYLSDHNDKAVPSAGHKAVAILLVEGKSQRIVLEPDGPSRLRGKAPVAMTQAVRGVVQITVPNGKTLQARFN
jgi:hypothetical protein